MWQERYLLCWVTSKSVDMSEELKIKPKQYWVLEFLPPVPLAISQTDQYLTSAVFFGTSQEHSFDTI